MKKITKIIVFALALGLTACDKKLDTVDGNTVRNASAVSLYMNSEATVVNINKSSEGGETFVEVRMSGLASQDVQATVSVVNFFEEYNKINNTQYRLLPVSEYELYEVDTPSNISAKGTLNITIKSGQSSERVGIRVKPLDEKTYPIGVKYAVPLKIIGTSAKQVLSNNQAVITFNRPFKTSVAEIKQGNAFAVKLAPEVEESEEITVQGQFMWKSWQRYSGNAMNMTVMNIGAYTRIFPDGLQVKDGGGDNPDDKAPFKFELNRWYQITLTCKDSYFKVYIDGKLIHTFQRTGVKLNKEMRVQVENPQTSYSANRYFREFRLWNRALTEAEIVANYYLPVDPESEGLVAYLPVNEENQFNDVTKYNNVVQFVQGTSSSIFGIQDGPKWHKDVDYSEFKVEWVKNVKFPYTESCSIGLCIEE